MRTLTDHDADVRRRPLRNWGRENQMAKKDTVALSNEEVADGIEFGSIVPVGELHPPNFWQRCWLILLSTLVRSLMAAALLIPALLYIWLAVVHWDSLKAEGVTVWHAGSGLVALYGLGLHWWRTSVQEKQFRAEREQIRLLNRQFRWQMEKDRQQTDKGDTLQAK